MTRSRRLLCLFYGLIAALALLGTGSQNRHYFASPAGTLNAFGAFVVDAKVTPASRSIAVDIAIVFLAAIVFMLFEARKLRIPFVWAYIVLGLLVAISVTFPLFLVAREFKLAALKDGGAVPPPAEPTLLDLLGLVAMTALALGLCWFTLA